jgi:hypothetical protein
VEEQRTSGHPALSVGRSGTEHSRSICAAGLGDLLITTVTGCSDKYNDRQYDPDGAVCKNCRPDLLQLTDCRQIGVGDTHRYRGP